LAYFLTKDALHLKIFVEERISREVARIDLRSLQVHEVFRKANRSSLLAKVAPSLGLNGASKP
jgi:hypothetical protein